MGRGVAAARTSGWPAMAGTPDFEAHPARRRRAAPDPGKALPPPEGQTPPCSGMLVRVLKTGQNDLRRPFFRPGYLRGCALASGARTANCRAPRRPGSAALQLHRAAFNGPATKNPTARYQRGHQPPVRTASPTSRKKAKVSGSRSPREVRDHPPRNKAAQLCWPR